MGKEKKKFPPGTFIPMQARVLAIIQLCLAITLLLWHAFQPFTGDLFTYKSRLLLLQTVTGEGPLAENAISILGEGHGAKLERNKQRFKALPNSTKSMLKKLHHKWQKQLQQPFFEQISRAIKRVVLGTSLWEQVWIALAIATSLLLLLKIEGAVQACWLLPIITFFYAIDVYTHPATQALTPDEALFPTEQQIFAEYLHEKPSASPLVERDQLKKGWELYLLKEWVPENDVHEKKISREEQIEQGEFAFHVARLELMALYPPSSEQSRQSLPFIILYTLWNLFFAYRVTTVMRREQYI